MPTWNSRGLRGSTLEDLLNRTNEKYAHNGLALIQKIPTPITPINIDKETRHLVTYKLFTCFFLGFFTWKAKCFFPNLLSIQAISIFQSNVCCKNHFSLVTFFHAICLLSKRFFSDESEKVWKSAETNTKIHLKDMVLVDDLLSLLFPIEFV